MQHGLEALRCEERQRAPSRRSPPAITLLKVRSRTNAGGRWIRFHLAKRWSWSHAATFNRVILVLESRYDIRNERAQFSGGDSNESF